MAGPTPDALAASGLEAGEQSAFFCWLTYNYFHTPELQFIAAIPNGGERNKVVAAALKREGVKRGVPDIVVPQVRFVGNRWWPGMWIEMKKIKGGKENDPDQIRWAEFLKSQGYAHFLCRGFVAAKEPIRWYFGANKPWRDSL